MESENEYSDESVPFPWHLGVFDAHCHPTDTPASLADIPKMKAQTLTVMATRPEDQDLVAQTAQDLDVLNSKSIRAAEEDTAERTQRQYVIPSFGWHPWFSHKLFDDTSPPTSSASIDLPTNAAHYGAVLSGDAHHSPAAAALVDSLPTPTRLSTVLQETEARLRAHPHALVGEVGLDRAFRIPNAWLPHELDSRDASVTPGSREGRRLSPYRVRLEHQRVVLKAQLRLAGKLRRAVSVHSVQSHGAVWEVLEELWKGKKREVLTRREEKRENVYRKKGALGDGGEGDDEDEEREGEGEGAGDRSREEEREDEKEPLPFPPRICLHSYSGPPDTLRQFLHPSVPAKVFFSFSQVINFDGSESSVRRVDAVIRALPNDRILVESDLHCAGDRMDALLEKAVRKICAVKGWELEDGVKTLGRNWKNFVFGTKEDG